MSQRIKIAIECPNCHGHYEQDFFRTLWGENENLRKSVMTDKVNIAECPHCHHKFHLPLAMLYVDAVKKFAVWWEPVYDSQIDEMTAGFSRMLGPGNYYETAPRITDWNEFKEIINKYYSGELKGQSDEVTHRQERQITGALESLVKDLEKKKGKKKSGCLSSLMFIVFITAATTIAAISFM